MVRWIFASAILLVVTGLSPAVASACILNSQSSLSANGYAANKNFDGSSVGGTAIPFVFSRVYGRGQAIHFDENLTDLKKSLSATALAHPFLWRWGDGTYSIARSPSHLYRHVGTYMISVYAYQAPAGGDAWSPFDRAQMRIVPPGELLRDNLGEDFLDLFSLVVTWGIRLVLGGAAALLARSFWIDWRIKRRRRTVGGEGVQGASAESPRVHA